MMLNLIKGAPESKSRVVYYVLGGVIFFSLTLGVVEYRLHHAPTAPQRNASNNDQQALAQDKNDRVRVEATKSTIKETRQFSGSVSQVVSLKEQQMKILTIRTFIIDSSLLETMDISSASAGTVRDLPMRQEDVEVIVDGKTALKGVSFDNLQSGDFVLVKTIQSISEGVRLSAETLELIKAVDRKVRD